MSLILAGYLEDEDMFFIAGDKIAILGSDIMPGDYKVFMSRKEDFLVGTAGNGPVVDFIRNYILIDELLDFNDLTDMHYPQIQKTIIKSLRKDGYVDKGKNCLNCDLTAEILVIHKNMQFQIVANDHVIFVSDVPLKELEIYGIGSCADMGIGMYVGTFNDYRNVGLSLQGTFAFCAERKGCGQDYDCLQLVNTDLLPNGDECIEASIKSSVHTQ